ncbi:MAG: hypothetical protein EF813_09895 [Methanosarcinales archaeon]|nr:MAG: hypothetical protein EF813_09895 [Methanosarcinales archaeon]
MGSTRSRCVCARIDDKSVLDKVKSIRETLGTEYRIIIENDRICVEGNIADHETRKKIDGILAG